MISGGLLDFGSQFAFPDLGEPFDAFGIREFAANVGVFAKNAGVAPFDGANLDAFVDSFLHSVVAQRKVFTTPLLTEANKRRNTKQFTKKKPRCQRGGVRGTAVAGNLEERLGRCILKY